MVMGFEWCGGGGGGRRPTSQKPADRQDTAASGNRIDDRSEGEPTLNRSIITLTGAAHLWLFPLGLSACGGRAESHAPDGGGGDSADAVASLTIVANQPIDGAMDVPVNGLISATFSDEMDAGTLTASTFTLTVAPTAVPVDGTVSYTNTMAVFVPTTNLAVDSTFTATITTGVRSVFGAALAAPYSWTFTTGAQVAGVPVNLRTAGHYAVLSRRAISGAGATVTGDVGISPSRSNLITGFALSTPPSDYATSSQVVGKVYARDYLPPTPANLETAVNDLQLAITEAAGRPPTVIAIGGEIGGMTLAPGTYNWQTVAMTTDITLDGTATDVWIFQVAGTMNMAASTTVVLAGGALPRNIFWQVTGAVTIGASAHLNGVVLNSGAFTSGASSLITGRLLSQMEITISNSAVVEPVP